MTDSVTLVLVTKRPRLYQGKQRLAATMGAETALELARFFLQCALEDLANWPYGPVVICPSDAKDLTWAKSLLPGAEVLYQSEGNLGERLEALDLNLRRQGHQRILFIGSDIPMLLETHYAEAFAAFNEADVVLSPAADGGVSLMGSACGWSLLPEMRWSTADLCADLQQACAAAGQRVSLIRSSYDVDEENDLKQLYQDLSRDQRPARVALYERLVSLFKEKEETYA